MSRCPFCIKKFAEKQKAHVDHFWHVGFGIPLFRAGLSPLHPQARNVWFATATAVAATTHDLAGHSHYLKRLRGMPGGVNDVCACKKVMLANGIFDAGAGAAVTNHRKKGLPPNQ
jgi:hypothetical protein